MLPVKKQFQPLLSSISQLIEPQNLIIVKPTWREGYIKKDKAFDSSWKHKTYCFYYIPTKKLICQIYDENGSKLEQTVDLGVAKLTKKCTQVDNRICFGLVTPSDEKYLIALKSNRQCMNIFNHVTSAKKILKSSMFRSQPQSPKKKIAYEQFDRQKELHYQLRKQSTRSQEQFQPFDIQNNSRLKQIKEPLLQQCRRIQNLKEFKLIKEFTNGNLYQNKQKALKITMMISSPQQPNAILDYFCQLDAWNSKVKKFNKIAKMQSGSYKFYLQFHKSGCFSSNKCCEVHLSLLEIDNTFYVSLSTVTPRPQYITAQNWVTFNTSALIKPRASNTREKEIYTYLESSKNGHLIRQFGNQLQNFNEYVKSKVKGEQRHLQIKLVE